MSEHELEQMQRYEDKCAEEDSLPFTDKIAEQLAKNFHETYERLAPKYNYKTSNSANQMLQLTQGKDDEFLVRCNLLR